MAVCPTNFAGDKVETAISIAFSCKLFTEDMQILEMREEEFQAAITNAARDARANTAGAAKANAAQAAKTNAANAAKTTAAVIQVRCCWCLSVAAAACG